MSLCRHFRHALLGASLCFALPPGFVWQAPVAMAAPQVSANGVVAARLALKGDFSGAGAAAQRSGDQAAVKLVELFYLRDHWRDAGYGRIMAFLNAAPNWPLTETLNKQAERALYGEGQSATVIMAHFANRKPATPEGMLALARAHLAQGNGGEGQRWLTRAWLSSDMDAALEKSALSEFGGMLSADQRRQRVWRLVYAQESNAALRNARRLGPDMVRAATVAQALLRGAGGAEKQYNGLPASFRSEGALKYALARMYRKQEKFAKARTVLAGIGPGVGDAEAWWEERRIIARRSVGMSHRDSSEAAYRIAANHGVNAGQSAIEGEFLAGWIALRYLHQPEVALKHFNRITTLATNRTEKSRAGYWIGRTHEAMGNKAKAKAAFEDASRHTTLYYGQLARERIGLGTVPEKITGPDASAAARAAVERDEVARAFQMTAQSGAGDGTLYLFLWSLAQRFDTVDKMNAVADMVSDAGGTSLAVKFAKAAGQRGVDIDSWSYPLRGLPSWTQIGKPIEKAMVFALSRQESEFNPNAGSKVGAQGLMQLMPGTARLVARQYRVAYAPGKLKGDPAYNVKLGAAHLADLVSDFNGSYVLTLVAYNAGPRRAREWVEEYGDPRSGQVDPVDWVESIPFSETRQYVQKVMQNLHIYRSRLAPQTVRPMTADLARGAPAGMATIATSGIDKPRGCGGDSIGQLIRGCD
jgi:soluble lytic murein transglycosylase